MRPTLAGSESAAGPCLTETCLQVESSFVLRDAPLLPVANGVTAGLAAAATADSFADFAAEIGVGSDLHFGSGLAGAEFVKGVLAGGLPGL